MFFALRALNASHNRLFGDIPAQWGHTGLFTLPPFLNTDGTTMGQVFSLSYNALTGSIPSFLDSENLRDYQSLGIELAVSNGPVWLGSAVSKPEPG